MAVRGEPPAGLRSSGDTRAVSGTRERSARPGHLHEGVAGAPRCEDRTRIPTQTDHVGDSDVWAPALRCSETAFRGEMTDAEIIPGSLFQRSGSASGPLRAFRGHTASAAQNLRELVAPGREGRGRIEGQRPPQKRRGLKDRTAPYTHAAQEQRWATARSRE